MVDLIEKQAIARSLECNARAITMEDVLRQNYQKGIVTGMRAAIALPKSLVAILREQFNDLLEQERRSGS